MGRREGVVEVHNPKGRRRMLMSVGIVMVLTGVDVALMTLSVLLVAAAIFLVNRSSGSR